MPSTETNPWWVGRCIPGIRELVSVPAGILNMNTPKFLAYTFAGVVRPGAPD